MRNAVIGAVVTAAVSTVGDYLWANVLPHGQPVYWFAHAIVLFLTIGACLGLPSRRPPARAVGAGGVGVPGNRGLLDPAPGRRLCRVDVSALHAAVDRAWRADRPRAAAARPRRRRAG